MALVIHWIFGLPFSFTAHAYDIYLVPRLLGVKVREAELVVTCARVNAAYLESLAAPGHAKHMLVNYHGVNLDRFVPPPDHGSHAIPTILTCGRLEPYKGHHILLRACAAMRARARCVLVGEGPQRQRLEQLAAELGIGERVSFTGPLSQAELIQLYAQADVFVLASVILERSGKRDVIPNVLVEAMAMQVPVVASDVSGIGELVSDGVSGGRWRRRTRRRSPGSSMSCSAMNPSAAAWVWPASRRSSPTSTAARTSKSWRGGSRDPEGDTRSRPSTGDAGEMG